MKTINESDFFGSCEWCGGNMLNVRKNAKFCCRRCKDNNRIYNKRQSDKLKGHKMEIIELVKGFEKLNGNSDMLKIYNLIYTKRK